MVKMEENKLVDESIRLNQLSLDFQHISERSHYNKSVVLIQSHMKNIHVLSKILPLLLHWRL